MISFEVIFDKASLEREIKACQEIESSAGYYLDKKKVKENGRKLRNAESKLEQLQNIEELLENCGVAFEILQESDDEDFYADLKQNLSSLSQILEGLKVQTLLSGKYDSCNAIVTIHAGAGGTEAQDWAEMLFRMYSMYTEKMKYTTTTLDLLDGDEAGLKGVTFLVEGENAYGYLKAEKGVHRLVRISPFDANARRHTSFASVEVMPELEDLPEIEIRPEDLRVDTYRSSGAGGQHVNKTDSAVRLTHLPTGIVVACQNERSQIQNRETAMRMLYGKLAEKQEREEMEKLAQIRGDVKKIEWGSQIRSYVFQPYTLVKDHRTGHETSDIQSVMNGNIHSFITTYLSTTSR